MSTEVVPAGQTTVPALASSDPYGTIVDRRREIDRVLCELMVEGVHYGPVPGTDKVMLHRAGTHMLASSFGIALDYEILEDLGSADVARYRVRCVATNVATGAFLGSNIAEASSAELAHKWRKASKGEWESTAENRRRTGVYADSGKEYRQVRTEMADKAHTILEVAEKRAAAAVVRAVLGCDDMFADLPPGETDSPPITADQFVTFERTLAIKGGSAEKIAKLIADQTGFTGPLEEMPLSVHEFVMKGLGKLPDKVDPASGEVKEGGDGDE